MSGNGKGEMFWAVHRKNGKEEVGIAYRLQYGMHFHPVHRIKDKQPSFSVDEGNITSIEMEMHPETEKDLIDYILDIGDKEWFLEMARNKGFLTT